mgnify:CR=1 FL=1
MISEAIPCVDPRKSRSISLLKNSSEYVEILQAIKGPQSPKISSGISDDQIGLSFI